MANRVNYTCTCIHLKDISTSFHITCIFLFQLDASIAFDAIVVVLHLPTFCKYQKIIYYFSFSHLPIKLRLINHHSRILFFPFYENWKELLCTGLFNFQDGEDVVPGDQQRAAARLCRLLFQRLHQGHRDRRSRRLHGKAHNFQSLCFHFLFRAYYIILLLYLFWSSEIIGYML